MYLIFLYIEVINRDLMGLKKTFKKHFFWVQSKDHNSMDTTTFWFIFFLHT